MTEITFYARGDNSTANNSAINTQNLSQVPVTELRFESTAGGDIKLDYNGGASDPDTIVYVDGVATTFTVEFIGTLPNTGRYANVNGQDLRGEDVVIITDDTTGQRYWFTTGIMLDPATVADFPNGSANLGNINNAPPPVLICFASGTLIDTPSGPRHIETLTPGDSVITAEGTTQAIRWHGRQTVSATGALAPIRIAEGTLGATRDLLVSPQHRMVIRDHRAQLYFGETEVLVPAKSLVGSPGIDIQTGGTVTYHHLLFDRHEIIFANGTATESYHPGDYSLGGLGDAVREELFALFPDLRSHAAGYGPPARPTIRPGQAKLLAA